jgi:hypothetical protein
VPGVLEPLELALIRRLFPDGVDDQAGFQAGVVSMIALSGSGARSAVSPAQTAPSDRANSRSRSLRANTWTGEAR